MMNLSLGLRTALLVCCAAAAVSEAAPVTMQNRALFFPAADLSPPHSSSNAFIVNEVRASSARGGRVSLVNTQAWIKHYAGPGHYDHGSNLAIDGPGNLYASGHSAGTGTGMDFVAVKYSPDGTGVWTNRYDSGGGDDFGGRLTLDENGNTFVTGPAARYSDAVALKYGPDGAPIHTNRQTMSGTNVVYPTATADRAGNVYMSSWSSAVGVPRVTIKFDPIGLPVWTNHGIAGLVVADEHENLFVGTPQINGSYAVTGIGSDGRSVWTNLFRSDRDLLRTMVLDRAGNLIVSGESSGGPITTYVTIKYSNMGVPLWTNLQAGPQYQGGNFPQILTDRKQNVFVIGGTANFTGANVDTTMIKLSPAGVPMWTNRLVDVNFGNGATGTSAVDDAGALYVLANSNSGVQGNFNFLIVKYTSNGTALWTNRFAGANGGDDFASAAEVDRLGNLYIAGRTQISSGYAFLLLKYSDYILYTPPPGFVGEDVISYSSVDASGNSRTNDVSVLVLPPALRLAVLTQDQSGVRLRADTPNQQAPIILETSSDLVHWSPVFTNSASTGVVEFLDAPVSNGRRFYRATQGSSF